MDMITPEEVVRRIDCYYEGGVLKSLTSLQQAAAKRGVAASRKNCFDQQPLNIHTAGMACDGFISQIAAYPGSNSGRGIIICGGGVRYFTSAWVCVNMLRHLGCTLPVEIWHFGPAELDHSMAALVEPLGVKSVDAHRVRKPGSPRLTHGWQLKPFAILNCRFREVLLLDADNVPVVDPEYLFDSPEFQETGAMFWPDYPHRPDPKATAIWRSCGLRRPSEPEFESGQILVNKERSWRPLCLSLWFNENASFYYQYIYGDKETFHLAFRKLKQGYTLIPPIHPLPGTMCQHDFDGRRIFQHRNRDKWDLELCNRRVPDFWFETECREFILQLREVWDGRLNGAQRH
jgi:hypothetical protein